MNAFKYSRYLIPVFLTLLIPAAHLAAQDCPCCTEAHGAFDFWVGEWEVTDPDGTVVGHNRIERNHDGCVLQEHWTGSGGSGTGTSLNYYRMQEGDWEQLWVSNAGSQLKLRGGPVAGGMVLSSDPFRDAEGRMRLHRITWSLNGDGTVRQHWELLESGQPVQTLFDGLYRKMD